ncbi:carcinoembryonic antigen-related cell adhesion molecule 6-like isoform X25 [Myotis daubentonii]|uniref:carcinoembryonic antigen-related cell adhesion molecule 6-like isoform X25 n=1 Tax=Myotis daubentonii TaxID=98922 RepID=UPI0028730DCE|nr:carcinoembryonic antigen-related cell adhesion molecule 6-like isoform X25 [Myotis daubentonii]
MESPSAPAYRGLVPRQGLLLAASLLTLWSLPSTAQLTIESVPPNAAEGKDVLLRVHNLPGDLVGYAWYKGETVDSDLRIVSYVIDTQKTTYGPAYSDREKIYPNGSLLFQNVTLKDTGYYTLHATEKNFQSKQVTGQLRVYLELPKPNITSNNSNPEEHKDPVVLTCESRTQNTTYLWLINSQSLLVSSRLQLSKDNRTLTLLPVTRNDTGPYECEIRNPMGAGRSDPFILNVVYGPDTPTISPSDSHYLRGTNLNLSCQAAANPPAQYSWFFNGSSHHPTQELFIPNVTSNDSGSYACLAHNSVTGLNRSTVKTITISEPVGKPSIRASNVTVTEHKDAVVLTCLTNDTGISIWWLFKNQSLLLTDRMKLSQGNSTLTIDPVRREDAGDYHCEVFNLVSSGISEPLRLDVQSEQKDTGYSVGTIVGSVIGVLVVVALGASLGYFLYLRRTRRASDPHGLREHPPPAATPGQGPSGTSAFPGPLPDPKTTGPIYEELLDPNTEVYCRIVPRADVASQFLQDLRPQTLWMWPAPENQL